MDGVQPQTPHDYNPTKTHELSLDFCPNQWKGNRTTTRRCRKSASKYVAETLGTLDLNADLQPALHIVYPMLPMTLQWHRPQEHFPWFAINCGCSCPLNVHSIVKWQYWDYRGYEYTSQRDRQKKTPCRHTSIQNMTRSEWSQIKENELAEITTSRYDMLRCIRMPICKESNRCCTGAEKPVVVAYMLQVYEWKILLTILRD